MGKPIGKRRRNVERGTSALYEGRFGERRLCQAFRLLGQGAERLSEATCNVTDTGNLSYSNDRISYSPRLDGCPVLETRFDL